MILIWVLASSLLLAVAVAICYVYIQYNDKKLAQIPDRALKYSPERVEPEDVGKLSQQLRTGQTIEATPQLPPKTGRRYIVVGGAGFLGGWIVVQLVQRGESPKNIRVLDIRLPSRHDLLHGIGKDVDYMQVDVSDAEAVQQAFTSPWPQGSSPPSSAITVFHTAANIRFYERAASLLDSSSKVNVNGTQNIIDSARSIGASILIYTSSGSVGVHASRFLLWPWQSEPHRFVQEINDDDRRLPTKHSEFFSNYAYSKYLAEQRVRAADKLPSGSGSGLRPGRILRTGVIRPGNGVFGPGGDMLCGAYLVRQYNPTWIYNIVSHFVYVENCALAHLCYEQRLIDLEEHASPNPDIGGQAFAIADPGPPPTYGDVYVTLETLSQGQTYFPQVSATAMFTLGHLIEGYYLARHFLVSSPLSVIAKLAKLALPPVDGDIVNLQPSLFNLTMVHLIFDDSRARLPPERGGLGYRGAWTTLEGLHKTYAEHVKGMNRSDVRSDVAGVSFGFGRGMVRAQRGVTKVAEKVEEVGVNLVKVLSH
ncbi:hypothetical protein D9757_003853 [Collybiopsis confluens]|uniref:3-beta hydroxysteroid dehydrogenase/isomerase domain-containing protein n=1 Tax=Collybiopsis confluens TaxID=2823264 RepID=A0A8H5HVP4_9AGAR|nr:hypothetical protein D9757_003853 [Collybiopsis confluens]